MNNLHKIVNNIKVSDKVIKNYDYQRVIDNLPFFLQLTKNFANNKNIQDTLVSSQKIRPRLSVYPNDGMKYQKLVQRWIIEYILIINHSSRLLKFYLYCFLYKYPL